MKSETREHILSLDLTGLREYALMLQGALDNYLDMYAMVVGEDCGEDEWHCSCVPYLRQEIERLRAELINLRGGGDK